MLQLLPNLVLHDSLMVAASKRFAKAFRETWLRIPEEEQRLITNFFVNRPGVVHLCFAMDIGTHPDEPWGRCTRGENEVIFTFLAAFVERADQLEAVSAVIAHELAHCYNHANGTWNVDTQVEECNARAILDRWGFREYGYGNNPEWKRAVEEWKQHRRLEFGEATEKRLFCEC